MARRVLTRVDIDQLLAAGTTQVLLAPGDIVTALAREHAQQRGLRLVPASPGATASGPTGAAPAASGPTPEVVAEIRRAVVAALGHEPAGLDAAIARALS